MNAAISPTDTYLGYGVYVEDDPGLEQIVLKVSREEGVHFIALTADELRRLNDFAGRCSAQQRQGDAK